MSDYHISFMEKNDIQESAKVLNIAMLNAQLHIAVLQGNSENERFYEKFGFKIVSESEIFNVKNRYMLGPSQTYEQGNGLLFLNPC